MPSAAPTPLLEARISTDFVVSTVQEAAQRAIEQSEIIRLSLADSERFAQAPCPRRTRGRPWSAPSPVAASCYALPGRHKSRPSRSLSTADIGSAHLTTVSSFTSLVSWQATLVS